jgi:hypothetical protein
MDIRRDFSHSKILEVSMRIKLGAAALTGCLLIGLFFFAPQTSRGDEWNLATRFTVSHQFEVPGMVLQADTPYVIRLLDSPSTRNVVQIYDEDQKHMLTMFMAIADQRAEPEDRTVFSFIETEPGFPLPIKEWFYPGRLNGLEFVYPKKQAREISAHAEEPILAADSTNLHDLKSIEVEAIGPVGTRTAKIESEAKTAKVTTMDNTAERSEGKRGSAQPSTDLVEEKSTVAENTTPTEPDTQQSNVEQETSEQSSLQTETEVQQQDKPAENVAQNEPVELPRTAGEFPLIALIGWVCLGAAIGRRVLSKKL